MTDVSSASVSKKTVFSEEVGREITVVTALLSRQLEQLCDLMSDLGQAFTEVPMELLS